MFQSIRKKVNSVLPDIESLYGTATSPTTTTSTTQIGQQTSPRRSMPSPTNSNLRLHSPKMNYPTNGAINFSAGCDILEYNESVWEEIHSMNEQNASKAQCIDLVIESLTDGLNKKLVDLSDINVSLETIPNIVKTVQDCSNVLHDVNKKCSDVERGLCELENLIEALHLQDRQLDRKLEMAMYREKKLGKFDCGLVHAHTYTLLTLFPFHLSTGNLEKVRKSLAEQHAHNVRETEKERSVVQKERQAVFQDAFQNDMKCYKTTGSLPSKQLIVQFL